MKQNWAEPNDGRKELPSAQEDRRQKQQVDAGATGMASQRGKKAKEVSGHPAGLRPGAKSHTLCRVPRAPLYFTGGSHGKNSFPEHLSYEGLCWVSQFLNHSKS